MPWCYTICHLSFLPLRTAGGGYHPLPQFMGFPDPSPEYSVRGLAYVNMHGDDTRGREESLPRNPHLSFP